MTGGPAGMAVVHGDRRGADGAPVALDRRAFPAVAPLKPERPTVGADPSKSHNDAPPTALARQLRNESQAACPVGPWGTCEDKRDEAEQLDPAGGAEEGLQALPAGIGGWTHL